MKRFEVLILIFFSGIAELLSQTENNKLKTAEDFFSQCYFSDALPLYLDALKSDSLDINLNLKIGICYYNSRSQKTKAIYYLEKAISSFNSNLLNENRNNLQNTRGNYTNGLFNKEIKKNNIHRQGNNLLIASLKFLGDAYHLAYKFDLAIASYGKFKNSIQDSTTEELIEKEITLCKFGKKLKSLTECPLNLDNAHKNINGNYGNFSSLIISDHPNLIFASYRYETMEADFNMDGGLFEASYIYSNIDSLQDFLPVILDTLPEPKSDTLITYQGTEATVGTSVDGHFVLIYKVENGNSNLYTISLMENEWTISEELNKTINIGGWEEDEFISADGTILYFSSKQTGGYGGTDIYKCEKLENGKWSKAKNLGPSINSPFDDETPFIYPDGNVLYFSSNRLKGDGSFDIFTSSLFGTDSWTAPINIGYPLSKTDHKFPDGEVHREKTYGNENAVSSTIKKSEDTERNNFVITFYNDQKASITLLKGTVLSILGSSITNLRITVTDNDTKEISGVYYPNSISGHYSIILPAGRNINITYEAEGYIFQSEHLNISKETNYYKLHKTIEMSPVAKGAKVILNNVFFDLENATINSSSNTELNNLFLFITDNPDLTFEIAYYKDSKKKGKCNNQLSLERVQSVINYLTQKGVDSERIIGKVYTDRKAKKSTKKNAQVENSQEEQLNEWLEMRVLKNNSKPNSLKLQ
ncbi:MAG: OmpA family protein [Bacteroidota bacterium]